MAQDTAFRQIIKKACFRGGRLEFFTLLSLDGGGGAVVLAYQAVV
jgi:hypothetical protein